MPREARGLARIIPTSPYLAHDPRHDRDVAIKILLWTSARGYLPVLINVGGAARHARLRP